MIKKFIMALVLGVMCISVSQAAAPKKIVGATAYQVTDLPSGVCESGVFTMTSRGFYDTLVDTTLVSVGVGPTENNNSGYVYVLVGGAAATTSNLYKVNATDLTQVGGATAVDIAPQNPDNVSSHQLASFYDTTTSTFAVLGNTTATTCNVGLNSCFHTRVYSNGSLTVDVPVGQAVDNASPTPVASAFNSSRYYVIYRILPVGTQVLAEYSASWNFISQGTITATSNFGQGVGIDDTYAYVTQNIGPSVIRYLRSNIAAGGTTFSPGFVGGNTLTGLTTDESVGYLYQPSRGTGATSNFVYRVATSTMTISNTLTLGLSAFMGKVLVDDVNDKLYVIINSGATTNQIVRLNRTTFASEATFNGGSSANGVNVTQAQIDIPHQSIYVPINGTGGGGVARVEKVGLCS